MTHALLAALRRTAPLALAAVSGLALAQSHTVKLGLARIDVRNTTDGVTGIGVPPGADLEVGDATTLILGYEYGFSERLGVELAVGLPPRHEVDGRGSLAFLGKTASVKQVAPTLFLNYHFGAADAMWRPFIGAGVNYTRFTGARSEYGQHIELADSVGPAGQLGVDLTLAPGWGLYANLAAARVKSKLVATGTTVQTTTINFRPLLFGLGVSYRF